MSDAPRQIWDDASVGEFALGVMPHAERLRFAAALQIDKALQERLAKWDENFVAMTDDLPDFAPPKLVFNKVEQRLFSSVKPVSLFERLRFWQTLSALGFGALALVLVLPRFSPKPIATAPLVAVIQGETLLLSARYNAADGTLSVLRKRGVEAAGEDFELWVIAEGGAPVSVGVLSPNGTTLFKVPDSLKTVMAGSTLAITNEPDGGSPSGKATGTILGTGTVVDI